MDLVTISRRLSDAVDAMRFGPPVTHVYDPLAYARAPHETYLRRYGQGPKEILFLGMNPGPWGMAQTGVPFGEVAAVRDFLRIDEAVGQPPNPHPKRPVQGFACPRSEVSGRRIWDWVARRFGSAKAFFARAYVANYCPLSFMEESGRNRTPDRLPPAERDPLLAVCDEALAATVALLKPRFCVGVGAWAEDRLRRVLGDDGPRIGRILHPSPASPAANRGWAEAAEAQLEAMGIVLPEGGAGAPASSSDASGDDAAGKRRRT